MEVSSLVKRPWTFTKTTHLPTLSTESPKTGFSSNQKSKGAGALSHWLKTLLSNLTDQLSLIPGATGERRELTLFKQSLTSKHMPLNAYPPVNK